MTGDALNAQNKAVPANLPVVAKPIDLAALRTILRPLLARSADKSKEAASQHAHEGVH